MNRDRSSGAAEIVTDLYQGWYSAMVRFATGSLRNCELAEEVIQDAFMELYKELASGRDIEKPRAWVMRVIRRKIWRHFGARADDQLEHESLDVVDHLQMAAQTDMAQAGELAMLLRRLSPREEEAILLRASGLGYSEIASELGLAVGTVGTLLSRALRKMQQTAQGGREASTETGDPDAKTRY